MSDTTQFIHCGACKNEIPIQNFRLHEATCLRHHYKCKECSEFVAISGKEDHDHLYHSMERCEKCGTKYKPIDKEGHFSVCSNALLKCEFCESDSIRSKFKEHETACGARTEKCESCDRYVMLRNMDNHICNATPQDFAVPVGTIFSSSSRTEVEITTWRQDHDVSPSPFTPTDVTGTDTISYHEQRTRSLFSADERDVTEPNPRDTIDKYDLFRARVSPYPSVDDCCRVAEPKREPMPAFDTCLFTPDPILPEAYFPLQPLEDCSPRDEEVPTPEYEPNPMGPCEFCGNQVPLSALDGHQLSCKYRNYIDRTETKFCIHCKSSILKMEYLEHSRTCLPRNRDLVFDRPAGPQETRELKLVQDELEPVSDPIPCEFCSKTFEISKISMHQENCTNYVPSYQPFGNIGMRECRHCLEKFDILDLYTHQIDCLSQQRGIEELSQQQKQQQQQTTTVERSNCKFCEEEFTVDTLSYHHKNCSKNPKNHCKHCLRYSSDPSHENICSYRHFNSKDVHIPVTKLPFASVHSDTAYEREGSESINNTCPHCTFPWPALKLEEHKIQCAKNPIFRKKHRQKPDPVVMGRYPGDERKLPDISLDVKTTKIGGLTPVISPKTNKLVDVYSQRDPSPHISKQQQIGRGIQSDDLYSSKQQQLTRKLPVSSFQGQNVYKQQQEPTKKGSLSPVLQFQDVYQQNTSKQQQQQERALRRTSISTLPFQETYQQLQTGEQQQQQTTKKTCSPTLAFQDKYHQQNPSKQQQQSKRRTSSPSSPIPS